MSTAPREDQVPIPTAAATWAWRGSLAVAAAVLSMWLIVRWGLVIVPVTIALLLAARTLGPRRAPRWRTRRVSAGRATATSRAVRGSARLSPLRSER